MSYAPKTITDLAAYWESQQGKALGIVGGTTHTSGYHLGKDRIYDGSGPGLGDNDYSVQLPRDKAGLTNAAAALDLGRLDGSLPALRRFSKWFVARCMKESSVRRDIREVIYSPDGATVQRYSGRDNLIHTGPGNGDDTHLTHTHISFMRDSQDHEKVWLFRAYFEEENMGIAIKLDATTDATPFDAFGTATLRLGGLTRVRDGATVALAAGTSLGTVQTGTQGSLPIVALNHLGELHVAPLTNVTYTPIPAPVPPVDTTPFDQADIDAAAKKAADDEQTRIAAAEAARINAL